MKLYHLGISGGKDSGALFLWAIHESGIPREQLRVTFCDTVNEDWLTYAQINMMDVAAHDAGIPGGVETLAPPLAFFELSLKKGRFPSRMAQFCSQELKIKPTQRWIAARWAEGHEVVVLNGKRLSESKQRRKKMKDEPERGFSDFWGCESWSPLRDWTLAQVLAIHERHKLPLNPLYALGATRVGCWPCINCGKLEIRLVAKHRPEKIAEIREWEKTLGGKRRGSGGAPSPFFAPNKTTARYRTVKVTRKDGKVISLAPIDKVVEWSQTERGGEQIRLPLDEEITCGIKKHLACE